MTYKLWTLGAALWAASLTSVSAQQATSENLLVGYDFETTSQSTVVTDISGNQNHGTIYGSGAVQADGILSLPGGSSSSGAGYVAFPQGIFDGKNTLTISLWLRNTTGAGNYAAMYFGSSSTTPPQYFLLNPCNPSGLFKAVITNSYSTSAPWNTEYGFSSTVSSQGMAGPATGRDWTLYTVIVTPTRLTAYVNNSSFASSSSQF